MKKIFLLSACFLSLMSSQLYAGNVQEENGKLFAQSYKKLLSGDKALIKKLCNKINDNEYERDVCIENITSQAKIERGYKNKTNCVNVMTNSDQAYIVISTTLTAFKDNMQKPLNQQKSDLLAFSMLAMANEFDCSANVTMDLPQEIIASRFKQGD